MTTPDGEVISICDRLVAAQAAREASDGQNTTLDPIDTAMSADFDRLTHLPRVTTPAGARALAKAAVALATRSRRGEVLCGNAQAEFLALSVAEFLAA
jgi:hypothetical protein